MTANLSALTRKFTDDEISHFQGKGGMTLSYVEDESVMDRLDEAYGTGGWSVEVEAVAAYEGVVKVRLVVPGAVYEDFGYANNHDGDVLKEAVTDGIRRCGRYLGIARDLYRKHATTQAVRVSPPARPAAPTPRPTLAPPVSGGEPEEPEWVRDQIEPRPEPVVGGECPMHHLAWVHKPAGTSKNGNPYPAFWACPSGPPFCKEKPSPKWSAQQEMAS